MKPRCKANPKSNNNAESVTASVDKITMLLIILGVSIVICAISLSVCIYTEVNRCKARRARRDREEEEINPDYVRGTSIYGHVGEFTDVNVEYVSTSAV